LEAASSEWKRLWNKHVWDHKIVREWSDVFAEARRNNKTVHIGRVFGICVEKSSELPKGDPRRKFKYRVVFQGNNVVTQNWEAAMFQDLGSNPSSMQSGKAADCYGCFEGHCTEQADAEQAYVQAELKGTETWVALPPEAWPDSWYSRDHQPRYHRPVVRLLRALYGHPDAGAFWEEHCDTAVRGVGFDPIPNWPSCYFNKTLKLFLVVYVDDFKMSGPRKKHEEGMGLDPIPDIPWRSRTSRFVSRMYA